MSALIPGSSEWLRVVTASKVAAILGLSPWESPRSLWHKMHGDLPDEETTSAQSRGHFLEPAILAWWRDQHDVDTDLFHWREQPKYRLGDWAAATPDAVAHNKHIGPVLVEAKSTADDGEWGEPGTDEIPAYYLTQVIWQMHVSGVHRCHVPIIGPRLRFAEYVVDYAPYAEDAELIERRCREFYDSLAADEPPDLDDTVATYEAVRKVHPDIDRGTEVELTTTQAIDLVTSSHDLKRLEAACRKAKSTVIDLMGNAQYATHDGVRIARRQPRGDAVTFVVVAKPTDLTDRPEESAA